MTVQASQWILPLGINNFLLREINNRDCSKIISSLYFVCKAPIRTLMEILDFKIDILEIKTGLEELANSMRVALYETDSKIFDTLNYEDDKIFLLPDLFYFIYATHNKLRIFNLKQLLCGYSNCIKVEIELKPDDQSCILLPNIGTVIVDSLFNLQLCWNRIKKEITLFQDGKEHPFARIKQLYLPNSNITVTQTKNQFLTDITLNENIAVTIENHKNNLITAWNKLNIVSPAFCNLIKKTTKQISLFNCKNQNSFAALMHFGTTFINVAEQEATEIFFIDDISHQCGHTIFYTLTLDIQSYFINNPNNSNLGLFIGKEDTITIYDLLHGLFTYTTTLDSLSKCYESVHFSSYEKIEISGRIAFYMQKFNLDLGFIKDHQILSQKGKTFYSMFVESYNKIYFKYHSSIDNYKFTKQPYFYLHSIFQLENKLEAYI